MDLRAPLLLLMSSGLVHMSDLSYNLTCYNDYESTLHCTLESRRLTNTTNTYLKFREEDEESKDILCPLSWQMGRFFCSAHVPIGFLDTDVYAISLCHHNNTENCELLEDDYMPVKKIKPKAPGNLTVSLNSSLCVFSWKSNYENYRRRNLYKELRYELLFHERGQGFNGTPHFIIDQKTTATVPDVCRPNSECVAKIRSCPYSQTYKGVWSDWSSEIYWRKPPLVKEVNLFHLERVIIPVCVLVPCLFVLCFIPLKKWRRTVFIPTPAPYFYSLYNDFHGDFKSWVVMEKSVELPKTEPTLHIDNMFECEDVCAAAACGQSGAYANVSQTEPDQTLDSATVSCTSTEQWCLSPQSRSPAEDSGCWLGSDQTLGKGPSWYCNDYCTLSSFQLKCATGELHVMEEIEL